MASRHFARFNVKLCVRAFAFCVSVKNPKLNAGGARPPFSKIATIVFGHRGGPQPRLPIGVFGNGEVQLHKYFGLNIKRCAIILSSLRALFTMEIVAG